jgi:hypothetical protein
MPKRQERKYPEKEAQERLMPRLRGALKMPHKSLSEKPRVRKKKEKESAHQALIKYVRMSAGAN